MLSSIGNILPELVRRDTVGVSLLTAGVVAVGIAGRATRTLVTAGIDPNTAGTLVMLSAIVAVLTTLTSISRRVIGHSLDRR